ncbi:hypothetical protein EZS27_030334 [termite gut metagenome]|uniref:Uncharacterized protein n=1 Tax=termite gut metagenome TaxID=433724 RepID=A0A5J4QFU8_9ZZZZ
MIMNNETQLTPEILQAVKNLQRKGYVPMLIEQLEEILDFFIENIDTDLSNDRKLEHISTQKSLKPFAVSERTITFNEEGSES